MLTVCCLYGGPPARLVALLEILRPVAGEIVVGVDSRVDPGALGPAAELADTLVRYEYADPPDRAREWLHRQARGDWVFWIDGDEVPSRALLEALAAPPGDVTHAFVPRRWLWRDGWLDEQPWWPDRQLRLVRPGAARFPGLVHIPIAADGPHRYLDAPLYHLDLLVKDRAAREEQVRRFEAARPGLRLGGRPLNEAYYLPESRDPAVAPIPDEDAELVARVLRPQEPEPRPLQTELRVASREEIDAHWADRPLGEDAYRARIEVGRVDAVTAGEVAQIDVRVANLGTETWRAGASALPEIRLSYRGLGEGLRTPLPHDVPPGGEALVPVAVQVPDEAGTFALTIDLVHERHRWFEAGAEIELPVRARRTAAILVGQPPGDAGFDARVDAVLAALDPELEPVLVGPKPDWLRDRFGVAAQEAPPARADEVHLVEAGRRRDRLRLRLAARTLRRDARR